MSDGTATPIGLIGLGAMGLGMARSMLRAGLSVRGYDVRAEAGAAPRRRGRRAGGIAGGGGGERRRA